jgi:hypothetical protein
LENVPELLISFPIIVAESVRDVFYVTVLQAPRLPERSAGIMSDEVSPDSEKMWAGS